MCVICVWGGMGGVGSEWVRGLGVGFTNPVGTEGVWDMCLNLGCSGVGGVGVSGLVHCVGSWGGDLSVCVVSLDWCV